MIMAVQVFGDTKFVPNAAFDGMYSLCFTAQAVPSIWDKGKSSPR